MVMTERTGEEAAGAGEETSPRAVVAVDGMATTAGTVVFP